MNQSEDTIEFKLTWYKLKLLRPNLLNVGLRYNDVVPTLIRKFRYLAVQKLQTIFEFRLRIEF